MVIISKKQRRLISISDATNAREYRWILLAALVLLFASRLALVLFIDVRPTSDMGWYYGRAIELLATGKYAEHGTPTAFWPVGYPGFLAGVMATFGTSVLVGQIANIVLSLISAILLYQLCIRYFESVGVATLAVCLLAIYPNHMGYSLGLYSEPLFGTLLLAIWLLTTPTSPILLLLAAGFLAGLATLVKAQMLAFAPPLFFLLSLRAWTKQATGIALRNAALATIVMILIVAPWTWRNFEVMGAFIPVSTNGGINLLQANNPSMNLNLRIDYDESDPVFDKIKFTVADQVSADRRASEAALNWISNNPIRFITLMPKKFFRFWIPDGESEWNLQMGYPDYEKWWYAFRSVRVINQIYYFALLAGLVYALFHLVRMRDPRTLAAPALMLLFTTFYLIFAGQSRHHAPLMPFVIAYAAWALVRIKRSPPRTDIGIETSAPRPS